MRREKGRKSDRELKGKGHQVKGKMVKKGDEGAPVMHFTSFTSYSYLDLVATAAIPLA